MAFILAFNELFVKTLAKIQPSVKPTKSTPRVDYETALKNVKKNKGFCLNQH